MIKQCDMIHGDCLDAIERYALEKERKKKMMDYLTKNYGLQVMERKKKEKMKIKENDFIRTCECIFEVKHKMRGFLNAVSIFDKKECWVDVGCVKSSSESIHDLLKKGDKILIKNDNGIFIESQITDFMKDKKKKLNKLCVKDIRDGELMIVELSNIVRVLELCKTKGSE